MKLLELLVKERIGSGWVKPWSEIKQNGVGEIFITKNAVTVKLEGHEGLLIADDWQTAIVTKEQYDNACKLVDDGYTLWFGGECPVQGDAMLDMVWIHNGAVGDLKPVKASDFPWTGSADLIAYKVVKPVLSSTHKHEASLDQFYANGWTYEQLIEHGYAKVAEPGVSCEVVPGKPLGVREPMDFNCRCGSVPVVTEYPAHSFLEKGVQHMKDRAAQRDSTDGERSMAACVNAFNAMFGKDLTETQGWQFMVLLKMARSRNKFNPDDYEDGAAYTGLAGEAHSHE